MPSPLTASIAPGKRAVLLAVALVAAAAFGGRQLRGQGAHDAGDLKRLAPDDNPTTAAKTELGRLLFWDPILSGHKDVACVTCHHPDFGYSDALPLSVGVNGVGRGGSRTFVSGAEARPAKRNSQTVLNTVFNGVVSPGAYAPSQAPMFWDTRVASLEAQALEPVKSAEEMRGHAYSEAAAIDTVVARLRDIPEYASRFTQVFGGREAVTAPNLARALASFERSLVAIDAPFDRYMRGDREAMTATQIQGMETFERVGCARCHSGPMFSDFKLHVLGVPDQTSATVVDGGARDTRAFRTPTLRNLSATGPYMHSGVFTSLNQVVRFYNNRGGRGGGRRGGSGNAGAVPRASLDPLLRELRGVGRNGNAIVAFLGALNDDSYDRTVPAAVPSGLRPGGRLD